ncbi:ATPase [Brachybacterium vulturis]|uniref:ATPase n=1 Tax=Brachybacterium vulturis TaxID=2017484 RepID=A0A291GJ73_9MICO|nr:SRPBCC domain-containing protein [Brachybacterium vulturis]ATG50238.1 ATPase [Brachybacterium vulturis]
MTASPTSQLTDVTRTVTPTSGGHVVALSQPFAVHPEELWSALTIGSHLELWFGRASGEVVEGGRYELPDMETSGTVLAVEEPRRLLLTWEFGKSRNQMELLVESVAPEQPTVPASEAAAGSDAAAQPVATTSQVATRFTLRHTVPADAHWQAFGPAATGCGWDAALYGLALHLADPAADQLPRLSRFAASPEGAEFTRATADAWFQAHVASGADKKPARKASVRTAAFYLGEEPELS